MADLDRDQLQKDILALYTREHAELGEDGTLEHLMRGKEIAEKHNLAQVVKEGGILVFPHAGVHDCGYQIAAAVHACLDSGLKRVVVISVLHAFTHEMEMARRAVAAGEAPADQPFYGIQGSGLDGREEWKGDHALMSWRHFWNAEVARRGLSDEETPEMIERYPWLAGGKPEELPGIEDLGELIEGAAVVSTADPFHHGIGYGTPPEEAFEPDEEGLAKAQAVIEDGMRMLSEGDYWGYNQHCVEAKSDHRDAGQVFRYLRGDMTGEVVDMSYSVAEDLYNAPPPTWVAGPLVAWTLKK